MPTSKLEITHIEKKSVLTSCEIHRPLKVFPLSQGNNIQVVFSNYGGGYVAGDHIDLNIECHADTTSVFTSQANTRIFKSESGVPCRQTIKGNSGKNATTVFLCDPVVPHTKSQFIQSLEWQLDATAQLLYTDWLVAGRILNMERYNFDFYESNFKVYTGTKLHVSEKFKIDPGRLSVDSPGTFLNHNTYINIFLVGNYKLPKIIRIESLLAQLAHLHFHEDEPRLIKDAELLGSASRVSDQVFILRCSALHHEMIQKMVKNLASLLGDADLLGFDSTQRRF